MVRLTDGARTPTRGGFVGGDGSTAVWVTVLAVVNPFWIEYAQEARMYTALLVEALGLSLLYLRWLDRGGRVRLRRNRSPMFWNAMSDMISAITVRM